MRSLKIDLLFLSIPPFPLPCHPDRSSAGAQWRDLRFGGFPLEMFFDRRIMGLWPTQVMKDGCCSATTVDGGTALPFVISTEAQRSGEICGSAVLSWKCFSTEESWATGPTQGDEKRLPFSNDSHGCLLRLDGMHLHRRLLAALVILLGGMDKWWYVRVLADWPRDGLRALLSGLDSGGI